MIRYTPNFNDVVNNQCLVDGEELIVDDVCITFDMENDYRMVISDNVYMEGICIDVNLHDYPDIALLLQLGNYDGDISTSNTILTSRDTVIDFAIRELNHRYYTLFRLLGGDI